MDPDHIPTTTTIAATTTTDQDQSSKPTTEDTDQINNEMGSGRSYECVFCKRGFTTAQALGGHMNIHRKDRVKNKPITPSKPEPFTNHSSTLRPMLTTTAAVTTVSHHQSFQTYFPTSSTWCLGTTTSSPPHDHQFSYVHNNPQVLNTFKDQNWTTTNMSLASQSSPTLALSDGRDKRSDGNGGDDDDGDEELDLELRLGHDR